MSSPDWVSRTAAIERGVVEACCATFVYRRYDKSRWHRIGRSTPVELWGFEGDAIWEAVRNSGRFYEANLLEIVQRCLPLPKGLVVDVGANIGNHSLFFAGILAARVLAVEPGAVNAAVLRRNLVANRLSDKVTVHECAAGASRSRGAFIEGPDENRGMAQVRDEPCSKNATIPIMPLDELVEAYGQTGDARVGLIKIDVEGMENDVLAGAWRTIERDRPIVIIEIANEQRCEEITGRFASLGMSRKGPFTATPTYIFAMEFDGSRLETVRYRIWCAMKALWEAPATTSGEIR